MKKLLPLITVLALCYGASSVGMNTKTASENQTSQGGQTAAAPSVAFQPTAAQNNSGYSKTEQRKIDNSLGRLADATDTLDFLATQNNPNKNKIQENWNKGMKAYMDLQKIDDRLVDEYRGKINNFMSYRRLLNQ